MANCFFFPKIPDSQRFLLSISGQSTVFLFSRVFCMINDYIPENLRWSTGFFSENSDSQRFFLRISRQPTILRCSPLTFRLSSIISKDSLFFPFPISISIFLFFPSLFFPEYSGKSTVKHSHGPLFFFFLRRFLIANQLC